jgi:hypothetical protein
MKVSRARLTAAGCATVTVLLSASVSACTGPSSSIPAIFLGPVQRHRERPGVRLALTPDWGIDRQREELVGQGSGGNRVSELVCLPECVRYDLACLAQVPGQYCQAVRQWLSLFSFSFLCARRVARRLAIALGFRLPLGYPFRQARPPGQACAHGRADVLRVLVSHADPERGTADRWRWHGRAAGWHPVRPRRRGDPGRPGLPRVPQAAQPQLLTAQYRLPNASPNSHRAHYRAPAAPLASRHPATFAGWAVARARQPTVRRRAGAASAPSLIPCGGMVPF